MKTKKKFPVFVLLICIPLFCLSSFKVSSQLLVDHRQNQTFAALVEQVNQARSNPEMSVETNVDASEQDSAETVVEPTILSAYAPLYAQNSDLFGWIEIEDTVVNYPVMHTPDDPEFYLHRAFDRSEAYSGVPFLDGYCFLGCGNYIVYGHNMKNKTMFKTITYYADKSYWQEHPTIRFDTLYETGTYDVVAAFYSQIYSENATNVFRYYQYTDLRDEESFTEYAELVKANALYETGLELEYGDQLLTLSTCEYHKTDGRFVIVAKKR